MAWTAELSGKKMVDGAAVLTVTFADDVTGQRFDETLKVQGDRPTTFLGSYVRAKIAELTKTSAWADTLVTGAITPEAEPVAPAPDPAVTAQNVWQRKYQRLLAWKRACDVGLESMTDPQFIALRDDVLASRLPGYRQFY